MNFCYNSGHGDIAQLGERLNGIQEVMGSSPTISIYLNSEKHRKSLFYKDFRCFILGHTYMFLI